MSRFYAAKGDENSIFTSWDECKAFLEGKKGYKYKSFSSREEAEAFLRGADVYEEILAKDLAEGYAVAFTDGSYEESVNEYSYGAVVISPSGEKSELCGKGNTSEFLPSRNVAGEVLGALAAVKWATINGYGKLRLYHDYAGLAEWTTGRWTAKSPIADYYLREFSRYNGCVSVEFIKVKGHSNNKYNEQVDGLAKAALFDGKKAETHGRFLKISGEDVFLPLCEYVRKQSGKVVIEERPDGYVFIKNGEKLGVYTRSGATLVSGDGERLFAIAVAYAIFVDKRLIARLLERAYGVFCEAENGVEAAEILIRDTGDGECGKFLFFALSDLAEHIKEKLSSSGVKFNKISEVFKDSSDGYIMKVRVQNAEETEKAYNVFYEYRTKYFSVDMTKEQASAALDRIKRAFG